MLGSSICFGWVPCSMFDWWREGAPTGRRGGQGQSSLSGLGTAHPLSAAHIARSAQGEGGSVNPTSRPWAGKDLRAARPPGLFHAGMRAFSAVFVEGASVTSLRIGAKPFRDPRLVIVRGPGANQDREVGRRIEIGPREGMLGDPHSGGRRRLRPRQAKE